jgi:hypothetical protein
MNKLSKQHQFLEKLIDYQIEKKLNAEQSEKLYQAIGKFLSVPQASDYILESITTRIIKLGVDYEAYISSLIFKTLPEQFTKQELVRLEEEIYDYIKKELEGRELDKIISRKLEEHTIKANPGLSLKMAQKKALGNWGWLLPHALTQLVIDNINNLINEAVVEANKGKRKGRTIRIKKMD